LGVATPRRQNLSKLFGLVKLEIALNAVKLPSKGARKVKYDGERSTWSGYAMFFLSRRGEVWATTFIKPGPIRLEAYAIRRLVANPWIR
jgi:hypothetical protein